MADTRDDLSAAPGHRGQRERAAGRADRPDHRGGRQPGLRRRARWPGGHRAPTSPTAGPTAPAASSSPACRRGSRRTSTSVNRSTAWTYTEIVRTLPDGSTESEPGIVVGSQVQLPADGQTYTIYFLFPLTEEEETLGLVTRALLTAAGLLLVLVAGITWLVTRQVVTPVRMARRVAERLAAGRLQERLRVTGEDDLARLAHSFNQMASNLQRQIRQLEELSWVQRRFVSDVSHELRTPLTTVRMAGDVLHDARRDFDPVDRPGRRAAAGRARPVRDAPGRPARDQPLRCRCGAARRRGHQPARPRPPRGRRRPPARRPARCARRRRAAGAAGAGPGRRAPGRAHPAQPRHQRDRPRVPRRPRPADRRTDGRPTSMRPR